MYGSSCPICLTSKQLCKASTGRYVRQQISHNKRLQHQSQNPTTYSDVLENQTPGFPVHNQVAFCGGYHSLLRRSEFIALKTADVAINKLPDSMKYIQITIRKSQADQRGEGAQVCLAPIIWRHINLLQLFSSWKDILAAIGSSLGPTGILSFNEQLVPFSGR